MKTSLTLSIVSVLIACSAGWAREQAADLHIEAVYHYRFAGNEDARDLIVNTIIVNRGEASALLPTANLGPSTAVWDGQLRVNYRHFLRRLQGKSRVVSSLSSFRPVELRANEALIIEYTFPIPAGRSLNVTVFFDIDEAVAKRYGFTQCSLKTNAKEGTISYDISEFGTQGSTP